MEQNRLFGKIQRTSLTEVGGPSPRYHRLNSLARHRLLTPAAPTHPQVKCLAVALPDNYQGFNAFIVGLKWLAVRCERDTVEEGIPSMVFDDPDFTLRDVATTRQEAMACIRLYRVQVRSRN